MQTLTSVRNSVGVEATPDFNQTLKKADLDWEAVSAPVLLPDGRRFPRKKMLFRSDNGEPLGIVGHRYIPSSPREFLERQYQLAEELGGKVERVGFLHTRASVFSIISFGEEFQVKTDSRNVGDPIRAFIYTVDGWNGETPVQSRLYIERLVCSNGMTSQKLESSVWIAHTQNISLNWKVRMDNFKSRINEGLKLVHRDLTHLAQMPVAPDEAREFFRRLLPGEHPAVNQVRNTMMNLFQSGVGNEGRTRYDLLNAVTEYVTHHRRYRAPETEIQERRFVRVMERDSFRDKAYSFLVESVGLMNN